MSTAYQQTSPYIPKTDAGFRDWLNNFATLIAADPGRYGMTAADAVVISGHSTAYSAAYVPVQSGASRTSALVGQKDAVKASANQSCRVYAMLIKSNKGVTNQDKIALGLHINDSTPSPIPAPTTAPLLNIVAAFSGAHEIRYADETTPSSRKKPHGVVQIQINRNVAVGVDPDAASSMLVNLYTRQPISVPLDQANTGQTATYFGRWVTQRGLVGPWSLPVSMTIAFGGPATATAQAPTGGSKQESTGGDEKLKIAA